MPKLIDVELSFSIPGIGAIKGKWEPDHEEEKASWELYVELVTRIAVDEMRPDEGLLGEALTSLHSLFATTRSILRKHGASIAKAKGDGNYSFGYMAIGMLSGVLRPILAKWHPVLRAYESTRDNSVSPLKHESEWEHGDELRAALNEIRLELIEYANLFAEVAGVPSFVDVITCDETHGG